jgi:hypothetical protein
VTDFVGVDCSGKAPKADGHHYPKGKKKKPAAKAKGARPRSDGADRARREQRHAHSSQRRRHGEHDRDATEASPIEALVASKTNPRTHFDDAYIGELAGSIATRD